MEKQCCDCKFFDEQVEPATNRTGTCYHISGDHARVGVYEWCNHFQPNIAQDDKPSFTIFDINEKLRNTIINKLDYIYSMLNGHADMFGCYSIRVLESMSICGEKFRHGEITAEMYNDKLCLQITRLNNLAKAMHEMGEEL